MWQDGTRVFQIRPWTLQRHRARDVTYACDLPARRSATFLEAYDDRVYSKRRTRPNR